MNTDFKRNPLDHNPFNVPFTLGEFVNRLADKFESNPAKAYTDNEVMFFVEEIILQMCNKTDDEMIKQRAMECLVTYFLVSEN